METFLILFLIPSILLSWMMCLVVSLLVALILLNDAKRMN